MKKTKLLTIVAVLYSMSVMGQSGKLDSLKINSFTTSGHYYGTGNNFLTKTKPSTWFTSYSLSVNQGKILMTVSDQKPDSTFHVWIDKKSIVWTSDSTFILKRKP